MENIKVVRGIENTGDSCTAAAYAIIANGIKVGVATVMIGDDYTYCDHLVVYEEYRNRGIGTTALQALSEEFCGLVIAPDNEDAQRLYARLGREWNGDSAPYIDQGFGVYEI